MSDNQNQIDVEVYPSGEAGAELAGAPLAFNGVQYLSLVNGETYGIPALIADIRIKESENGPFTVLYVNPENVSAVLAKRVR